MCLTYIVTPKNHYVSGSYLPEVGNAGVLLVVGKDLTAQFLGQLSETKAQLCLNLIVEVLPLELGERVLGSVVVEVHRIKNELNVRGVS